MLAAQLARPPATNQTMVGLPCSDAIVAVVPAAVVNVPLGAGGSGGGNRPGPPSGDAGPSGGHGSFPTAASSWGMVDPGEPLT